MPSKQFTNTRNCRVELGLTGAHGNDGLRIEPRPRVCEPNIKHPPLVDLFVSLHRAKCESDYPSTVSISFWDLKSMPARLCVAKYLANFFNTIQSRELGDDILRAYFPANVPYVMKIHTQEIELVVDCNATALPRCPTLYR